MKHLEFKKSDAEELATLPKKSQLELSKIVVDIETRLINIKRDIFMIGKQLSVAKSILPHSTFELWIAEHFNKELPISTANLYKKIYDTFKDNPSLVQKLPVSFLLSMTQKTFPEELITLINENLQNIEKVDIKTINESYQDFKNNRINLDDFLRLAKKQIDLGIAISKGIYERRLSTNMRKTIHYTTDEIVVAIRKNLDMYRKMGFLFPPIQNTGEKEKLFQSIDQIISELEKFKTSIEKGEGFFQPMYSENPLLGMEYVSNENSNN